MDTFIGEGIITGIILTAGTSNLIIGTNNTMNGNVITDAEDKPHKKAAVKMIAALFFDTLF